MKISWKHIFLLMAVASAVTVFQIKPWERYGHRVIQWDVSLYYLYLPATLIYNDVGVSQPWPVDLGDYQIGLMAGQKGRGIIKMSSGMAWAYLPAFAIGHTWALFSHLHPADGFSRPYHISLAIWVSIYIVIGLWFLFCFVKRFVAERVAFVSVLIIFLGTNMIYFVYWDGGITHAATFTLLSSFLEIGERYITKQRLWLAALLGFLVGWMVLIRPINALPLLMIAFWWGIRLRNQRALRLRDLAVALPASFILIAIQMMYWKYVSGSFISYSYGDEGFFWGDPKLLEGLFSWRKGWLIYTPVMALALAGFIPLYIKNRLTFWLVVAVFASYVYMVFSWWCWWYGGGYGQRALIDIYPLLALPFAYFLQWVANGKIWRKFWVFNTVLVLVLYNFFTTWQAMITLIHWDSMTKGTYKAIFLQTEFPPHYGESISPPDYEAAMKGDRNP